MNTEAITHGHAAAAGSPTTGMKTRETPAAPSEIATVVASGSSPRLIDAFHVAWQAAANRTAAKTKESIQNGYCCGPVATVIQRTSVKASIAALPPKRP